LGKAGQQKVSMQQLILYWASGARSLIAASRQKFFELVARLVRLNGGWLLGAAVRRYIYELSAEPAVPGSIARQQFSQGDFFNAF
jgi:hypothetical protein